MKIQYTNRYNVRDANTGRWTGRFYNRNRYGRFVRPYYAVRDELGKFAKA